MKTILTFLIVALSFGNATAQFTKLLDFDGPTYGSSPNSSLISDGIFLYGMTQSGGASNNGTAFRVLPDGTGFTKIINFNGTTNGRNPKGSLLVNGTFLYGMTYGGGGNNLGSLFKVMPNGTLYEKLVDFDGTTNGNYPYGSLISDGTFLYGLTFQGGANGVGTIFKILPNGSGYGKLFDFDKAPFGNHPIGSLFFDGSFLYGMTPDGGADINNGLGTLFKIMPDGTGYSKLVDFTGVTNGRSPWGSLISDGTFLYGMTTAGGINNKGTLFKLMPNGTLYEKLLDFDGINNGSYPYGSLLSDGIFLYGMTANGGTSNLGTIFRIKTDGSGYIKLVDFDGEAKGSEPHGSLISDGTFLYGMTSTGGIKGLGTIFKYSLSAFLSINDTKNSMGFSAFPNPVKEILTIRNLSGASFEKVIITDLAGKKVMEQSFNLKVIDVSKLLPGMYLLQMASSNKISVIKFIKQ